MTRLLEKAVEQLKKLPSKEQDELAKLIIDEINWEYSLDKSEDKLSYLASEALAEYKNGKTKPLNLK
ncbi:MAG: hypothetical protein WCO28_02890 [Bacteroidota bacterium]